MKATVVIDNIGNNDINGEWGLCIYIEYKDNNILLDTGASNLFVDNCKRLGIALSDVDYAVLSHAHYDHGGGMREFFDINKKAKFYLRAGCGENCYKKVRWLPVYIGIPKKILGKCSDRIVMAEGDYKIAEGITLVPHKTSGLEKIGIREKMYIREGIHFIPERFVHEQSLVFDTDKGLVIFNSCSHGGADNIINEVAETFPDKKVFALIGGFHLYNKTDEEVHAFARRVGETGIEHIYTGHCTGEKAYNILKEDLGDIVHRLSVGLVMEF